MKKAKKLLSVFLAIITLFSTMSVGFGGIAAFAAAGGSVTVAGASSTTYNRVDDVIITVPETIYMTPTTGASVSGQYFVNNIVDANGKVTLATDAADTTGQISIYAPGATAFSLNVTAAVGGIGEPVIGGSATDANSSYEGTTWTFSTFGNASDYATFDGLLLFINGTGVSMGSTASIKWEITLTFSSGSTATYYAYSTLYTPHLTVGSVSESRRSGSYNNEISSWISGINGLPGGWSPITSGSGNSTTAGYFTYDPLIYGLQGGSSQSSNDYITASSTWLYAEGKAPDGADWTRAVGYLGSLTIDASRYSNINQIPNLKIGADALRVEGSKKDSLGEYKAWYAIGNNSYTIGTGEDATPSGWTQFLGLTDPQATSRNVTVPSYAVSSINGLYIHTVSQGWCTYLSSKNYATACASVLCTTVDKSALRNLVLQCASLNYSNYAYGLDWFKIDYENAAYVLGNPSASQSEVDTAVTRLNYSINGCTAGQHPADSTWACPGLQIDINFNGNGGSVSAATQRVTIGTATTISVTPPTASRTGYTFKGWATSASATSGVNASSISVSLYSRNLYATWEANKYSVVFDNLLDVSKWNTSSANNGTISNVTENGFTLTSNDGAGEGTSTSPLFPVTAGKNYVVDIDFEGDGWDVYIFFYDANTSSGTGIEFKDGPDRRFSSSGVGNFDANGNAVFTAPAGATRAVIRVDANGSNNAVTFKNIKVYEEGTVADGVSYHASKTVTYGQSYGTLPTPTRPGYTFAGWYDDNGSGYWDNGTVTFTSDLYLNSTWNANTYKVTFEKNLGDGTSTQTQYTPDDSVTVPTLTRNGYTLTGWNVTTADGNWSGTYNAGDVLTGMYGSPILQAQWEIANYTITYDANGGSCSETTKSYTISDTVTLPTPTRTGYTFAGWKVVNTDGNWSGTNLTGNVSSKYGAVNLQAQWTPIPYAITFYDWDGKVLQQSDVNYDSTPTPPADPTRAADNGYTYAFKGWDPTVVAVTGAATYTATYNATLIPYTITLDAGEGSVTTTTIDYNWETTSVTLPDATRTGYTFTGWTVKTAAGSWSAGATVDGTLSNAYGNVTLVANYTPKQYTVTYDANGGTIEDGYDSTFTATYDSEIGALLSDSEVSRTGYTFTGWKTSDGTEIKAGDIWKYTENVTVYAQWTAIEYSIDFLTFDTTNNKVGFVDAPASITYTIEDDLSEKLPDTTVEGYNFNHWLAESTSGSWIGDNTYATADLEAGNWGTVTLVMFYTAKSYTITWVNYDSTVLETDTAYYGSTPKYNGATPEHTPTAQYSYTFAGWSPAVTTVTGDQTYTATYNETEREYTIKFVDWNDTVISEQSLKYGETPVTPADPTREQDAQYTYTFVNWKDGKGGTFDTVPNVTADVAYTADYIATLRSYTITWIVDGKTTTTTVAYGETPKYDGTPSKDATDEYTYTFEGWSPSIADVTGEATYTAQFSSTKNTYTVKFVDEDGTTVLDTQVLEYGVMPKYKGETPTKAADVQYTYTFDKWTPAIDTVTGNVTYTATYSSTVNEYTITFADEDGTTLGTQTVKYGDTPEYDGDEPTKAATAQYTYTFAGWSPAIAEVTGDATYTATYDATVNKYTITFVDEDGTTLQSSKVAYGEKPTLPAEPSKDADAQYTYTFAGWTPVVVSVTGEATYTATYTSTIRTYTVTWYNYDGSVIETDTNVPYGAEPSFDSETPSRETDGEHIYAFSGWATAQDGEVINALPAVNGEMAFYAIFVSGDAKFDVEWTDANGNVIETDTEIAYGTTADTLAPAIGPEKTADAQYTYEFIGWNTVENSDTALNLADVKVTSKTTFYPVYSKTVNKYTITFVNEGGAELQSSEVEYGTVPAYTGSTPTKAATVQYTYTFAGWDNELVAVTGEATYTATYDSTVNKYTIKFVNENGDVLQSSEVAYGDTPVYTGETPEKAATAQYTYTHSGWTPAIETVTGDAIYTATYDATVNEYTIKFVNENGDVLQSSEVAYGETPVYTGETPTKAADVQYTYTFKDWGTIVAVTGEATYTATYDSTVNKYTIKFVNENGDVLQSSEVAYGDTPVYTGETPEKAATAQYTYTHSGWTPAIETVTGDAIYTATYDATVNEYTITWVTGAGTFEGTWEYGSTPDPVADGVDTSKASTVSTAYTFANWDVEIAEVTGDATYTAQYTETTRKYTITWIVDGTETTEDVEYGTVPTAPAAPSKDSTVKYEYTFTGWDNEIVAVDGDATYTAEFAEAVRKYTITWVTGSGEYTSSWEYGSTPDPEVDNVDTSKAPTAEASYTFSGWDKTISVVTGATTYTAQYDAEIRSYTVTYIVDGEIFAVETVKFGSNFSHPVIPEKEGHSSYWDVSYMTMPAQDIAVSAVYTAKKYTVTWIADGKTVATEDVAYGSSITSQPVPAKVGHDGVWDNIPATMPAENVTITAVYTPAEYTVVWTFSTSSGTDIATYGETWSVVFINYVPGDVRITVNGLVLSSENYSYDADSGYLQINPDAITGNITITEKAAEGYQNVTISAVNATVTNMVSIVKEGTTFHTQIVPNEGYLLPTSVIVCIDGIELHSGYTYDLTTGRLTVNGDVIFGELSIRFESPVDPEYGGITEDSHRCTCNCHSTNVFVKFFFSIGTFFRKLFGMNQYRYCDCGNAHW